MFVLAKDVLVVCVEVVNKESGQVGGVSGEAGVPGFDEYVVNLGKRGSDGVGHVIVRRGPACVSDLIGVLVFNGSVGFLECLSLVKSSARCCCSMFLAAILRVATLFS